MVKHWGRGALRALYPAGQSLCPPGTPPGSATPSHLPLAASFCPQLRCRLGSAWRRSSRGCWDREQAPECVCAWVSAQRALLNYPSAPLRPTSRALNGCPPLPDSALWLPDPWIAESLEQWVDPSTRHRKERSAPQPCRLLWVPERRGQARNLPEKAKPLCGDKTGVEGWFHGRHAGGDSQVK